MKKTLLTVIFLITCCFYAVTAQTDNHKANIGFYNLENLFDTINDPNKDDEQFLPEGAYQWTAERYQEKLEHLSHVIEEMAKIDGGLVVLGVSEVENEQVLLDLVSTPRLKPLNLSVCHHESPDRRGVDVAFLYDPSRFRILSTKAYPCRLPEDTNFITRDQWLMNGILDGSDTLRILVNHWPSKLGGEKRSMPKRMAAALLSRHIVDSLTNASPNAKVIVMGDLNDNPNAKSLMEGLKTHTKTQNLTNHDVYNPMWKMFQDGIGSYAYRDSWELLDNIIVSGALVNAAKNTYQYTSAHIFRKEFMITKSGSYMGYPFRMYAAGIYQGGYSDHLPVYIVLTK